MNLYPSLKIFSFLFLFSLAIQPLLAQYPACGTDSMNARVQRRNPQIKQLRQQFERRWRQQQMQGSLAARQVYTIPVVVHLVHNNGPANLTDPQVNQAIDALNDGMRNRGVFNPQTGVDTEIEFCLAVRDPNGMATTGITRTVSSLSQLTMETEDLNLKNLIRWDPTQYLNIWVVNSITSLASGPGVAGYAYFPSSHGQPEDGIVGEAAYFTRYQQDISIYIHEVGHYLGLYHTFEGGCHNNDCLQDGDRICDTPPDASTAFISCAASPNSCHTDGDDISLQNPFRPIALGGLGDQPDMIDNYMDYGDPFCLTVFTAGQKARMVLALTSDRRSLLQSQGCISPCNQPVTATFSINNLPASVGSSIQLQHVGNGPIASFEWEVNGQPLSQTANASYTFNQSGTYIFSLRVLGTASNCTHFFQDTLEVFCEPRAVFAGWQSRLLPGDTLHLTATGPPGSTYTWLVNGAASGTGPSFVFTASQAASVLIQLIAANGNCADTSAAQAITVGNCIKNDQVSKTFWMLEDSLLMDFSSGSPTIQKGSSMQGAGAPSATFSSFTEHSVSLSDPNGNLLFYSNGQIVWDRNHQVMPNGRGILGDPSAMQGSIAFPDPGNPDVYYLFTLDSRENNFSNGLRYTKIDMRLRGGLGDVIPSAKNIFVMLTHREIMHAVYHANGNDVWVVVGVRGGTQTVTTRLNSILVNGQGVNLRSVSPPLPPSWGLVSDHLLKFSHNGRWLGVGQNLYHFDKQSGVARFFINFSSRTLGVRGIEFSEDNTLLYLNGITPNLPTEVLHQYTLSSGVPSTILATKVVLIPAAVPSQLYLGKLEMGRDGKIYGNRFLNPTFLVIHNPSLSGAACNVQINGFNFAHLQTSKSSNLPAYVRGKPENNNLNLLASSIKPCPGEPVQVWATHLTGNYQLAYTVVGSATLHQNGRTLFLSDIIGDSIKVIAQLHNDCGIQEDSLWIHIQLPPAIDLGTKKALCAPPMTISGGSHPDWAYLWSTGARAPSINISQTGTYWLQVTDTVSGCLAQDTVLIIPTPPIIPVDLGPDLLICPDKAHTLSVGNYPSVRWWNGRSSPSQTVFEPGVYWVEVEDECGNVSKDTVRIATRSPIIRDMPDSAHICRGGRVTVDMRSSGMEGYRWENGLNSGVRTFTLSGTYYLQSQDNHGCLAYDTLHIIQWPSPPPLVLPIDPLICQEDSFEVNIQSPGWLQYQWSHGAIGPRQTFYLPNTYTVVASDVHNCTERASFQLAYREAAPLPLEANVEVCLGDTVVLIGYANGFSDYQWHDGLIGSSRKVWENGRYSLHANDPSGCHTEAQVTVQIIPCDYAVYMPNAFTPNDDGHNDWFGIQPRNEVETYHLVVFNRWGLKVYDSDAPIPGWDGTYKGSKSPEGVYVWVLNYSGLDGRSYQLRGSVTLIR